MSIADKLAAIAENERRVYNAGYAAGAASGGSAGEHWIGDGDTHIWITLKEGRTSPMLGVRINGTVTVDWGDGTAQDTLTGTSTSAVKWTPTHEYAKAGDYVITLIVDGKMAFGGSAESYEYAELLRHTAGTDGRNRAYHNSVRKVEIGNNTLIGHYAFFGCNALASIRIPDSVTSIGSRAFSTCHSLTSVNIPNGVTDISTHVFNNCLSLASVSIPNSVTNIGGAMFYGCNALATVSVPDSVKVINEATFLGCSGLSFCDFTKHTEIPTLRAANAFSGIPTDCQIRVPAALYDEWITATNWVAYASQIIAV